MLVDHGADVNAEEPNGYTPLIRALDDEDDGAKSLAAAKILVAKGADVNHVAKSDGMTPWAVTRKNKQVECSNYLRAHGAK